MALPRKIPKVRNRSERWRSAKHCNFVRGHECCVPGCQGRPIEVAHLRVGTDAAMGRKASDFYTLSLCADHHRRGLDSEHTLGFETFQHRHRIDMHALAAEFAEKSPVAAEIRQNKRERGL